MSYSIVYITAKDSDEAQRIGSTVVLEKLAACVNIINGMNSIYWWENRVEMSSEVVIIAKTGSGLVGKLTERVKQLHSYKVPCIVSWKIEDGNPEFLKWIGDNSFRS